MDFVHGASISGASFTNVTNNNNNVTNNANTDADEYDGTKNEFWWDYSELQKRENELEAQLYSKDQEINKVIINDHFIIKTIN